jgi:hypothetical protein
VFRAGLAEHRAMGDNGPTGGTGSQPPTRP